MVCAANFAGPESPTQLFTRSKFDISGIFDISNIDFYYRYIRNLYPSGVLRNESNRLRLSKG